MRIDEILLVVRDISCGLTHLHKSLVAHRSDIVILSLLKHSIRPCVTIYSDIKPDNIMFRLPPNVSKESALNDIAQYGVVAVIIDLGNHFYFFNS